MDSSELDRMDRLIRKESTDHGLSPGEADELYDMRQRASQPQSAMAAEISVEAGANSDRINVLKPGDKGHPWSDEKHPGKVKPEFEALVPTHRWAEGEGRDRGERPGR